MKMAAMVIESIIKGGIKIMAKSHKRCTGGGAESEKYESAFGHAMEHSMRDRRHSSAIYGIVATTTTTAEL